jgi:hypothetical protein
MIKFIYLLIIEFTTLIHRNWKKYFDFKKINYLYVIKFFKIFIYKLKKNNNYKTKVNFFKFFKRETIKNAIRMKF